MVSPKAVLIILAVPTLVYATSYPVIESWSGSGFIDGFDYPASYYDNTTNGDVFWATPANTSLIYVNDAGRVIMKVDNTSYVDYPNKRYAPSLLSKTAYSPGTVWVLDAVHMPYGCSVWPAFWTQGPNWPAGGEIDIMEGINMQTTNQVALHTEGGGCLASTSSITGSLTYDNCSIDANSGSGCTVNDTSNDSYGAGFAAAGGGVYIAEFASEYIRVWFFTRSSVPSSLSVSSTSLDTSTLGTPLAEYDASACDIEEYFGLQTLTIDITLCGTWAGEANLLAETCPTLVGTNTCYTTYVIDDASTTYANAYFEINYINVFSNSTTSNVSEPSGTGSATTTVTKTSAAASTSQTATGSTSSSRRNLDTSIGGLYWAGALLSGVLAGVTLIL